MWSEKEKVDEMLFWAVLSWQVLEVGESFNPFTARAFDGVL